MKIIALSTFCMELSFLLGAGLSIDEALSVLAEDAETEREKNKFLEMSLDSELGMPLAEAMEKAGGFPDYTINMTRVGQETGNLEVVMAALAEYYEKENSIAQNIKNAATYPVIMVSMLIVVLFVLLTKVMPIFESVYRQLGAELSPITQHAVSAGTVLTGAALVVIGLMAVIWLGIMGAAKKGKNLKWTEKIVSVIKEKSRIANVLAKRRIASVMAIAIKSGLNPEAGTEMAEALVTQKEVKARLRLCVEELEDGKGLYEAYKETGLFTSLDLQLIKVGSRSGKSDVVFNELAKKFETEADTAIDNAITRFEPTMVAVLAVVVGLILLSVMMPLVGIMASIG